jgi:hypothetical protein
MGRAVDCLKRAMRIMALQSPQFGTRRNTMSMKVRLGAALAVGAFFAAGPLQHVGTIPQSPVGDASKAVIKAALNLGAKEAYACFPGRGSWGNNGFGNGGGDGVPGRSGFTDSNR